MTARTRAMLLLVALMTAGAPHGAAAQEVNSFGNDLNNASLFQGAVTDFFSNSAATKDINALQKWMSGKAAFLDVAAVAAKSKEAYDKRGSSAGAVTAFFEGGTTLVGNYGAFVLGGAVVTVLGPTFPAAAVGAGVGVAFKIGVGHIVDTYGAGVKEYIIRRTEETAAATKKYLVDYGKDLAARNIPVTPRTAESIKRAIEIERFLKARGDDGGQALTKDELAELDTFWNDDLVYLMNDLPGSDLIGQWTIDRAALLASAPAVAKSTGLDQKQLEGAMQSFKLSVSFYADNSVSSTGSAPGGTSLDGVGTYELQGGKITIRQKRGEHIPLLRYDAEEATLTMEDAQLQGMKVILRRRSPRP